MDTSKKTEDDTIRDEMEKGYVATRPRFTRARRTWTLNVRNLVAEDVRALDQFFMVTAARGGNAFLFPNLVANGSFELPVQDASDIAAGWNIAAQPAQVSIGLSSTAAEGSQALKFISNASQTLAAGATVVAEVDSDALIPCQPGEVYVLTAQFNVTRNLSLGTNAVTGWAGVTYYDSNGNTLSSVVGGDTLGNGWLAYGYQFTVPANAASFKVQLFTQLHNGSGTTLTLGNDLAVAWDAVGCALQTPLTPHGRMVGSQPLGCLVRFSKMPEFSDIGWASGAKAYGAAIELQEV